MWLDNLRTMKEHSGMTTKEISKKSGIPEPTLEKLFSGATRDPKLPTMQKLVHFFGYTLDDLDDTPSKTEKAPPYSGEARELADAYDNKLDQWGRQAVRELVETETARCEEEARLMADALPPKVISLFLEPSAAGIAAPTLGRDYEPYTLGPSDPPGAAYAVRIRGDSMEPYYPDGSIVFVNHDALRDGEVGIFCVDGGTVCKQYHKEGPMTFLFSLNRKRQDADIMLLPGSNRPFFCQGRVMGQRRFPVPGR